MSIYISTPRITKLSYAQNITVYKIEKKYYISFLTKDKIFLEIGRKLLNRK